MKEDRFDTNLADSQATKILPMNCGEFDFSAYSEYEQHLLEKCQNFWESPSGVLVYRRMRIAEVFSYGCKNMKESLEWQLGGLHKSMDYKSDIPNFLEPWYGIGTVASSFGRKYVWHANQAPAISEKYSSIQEALEFDLLRRSMKASADAIRSS
jgi:hypothetical protein